MRLEKIDFDYFLEEKRLYEVVGVFCCRTSCDEVLLFASGVALVGLAFTLRGTGTTSVF